MSSGTATVMASRRAAGLTCVLHRPVLAASSYQVFLKANLAVVAYGQRSSTACDACVRTEVLDDGRLDLVAFKGEEGRRWLGGLEGLADVLAAPARPDDPGAESRFGVRRPARRPRPRRRPTGPGYAAASPAGYP